MKTHRVRGLDRDISQVVLGTMAWRPDNRDAAYRVMDAYVSVGGNCLDTARIYAGGASEEVVGGWIADRGIREDLVLVAKGACTTDCTPELVERELEQSLNALGTDVADVYLMHRDNPAVPIGEFVEALNEHLRAGRVRTIGGSNWTIERIEEANRYAESHGLVGFAASSPNLSLARWNAPPWPGTVSASDPESRRWYASSGIAVFAWSSQAGGFFTGRYPRESASDPAVADVARVWFNDDNFQRQDRVAELARRHGVDPVHIAIAAVTNQPFPVFALVGPLNVEELRSSLDGASIRLTPDELAYLQLDDVPTAGTSPRMRE